MQKFHRTNQKFIQKEKKSESEIGISSNLLKMKRELPEGKTEKEPARRLSKKERKEIGDGGEGCLGLSQERETVEEREDGARAAPGPRQGRCPWEPAKGAAPRTPNLNTP